MITKNVIYFDVPSSIKMPIIAFHKKTDFFWTDRLRNSCPQVKLIFTARCANDTESICIETTVIKPVTCMLIILATFRTVLNPGAPEQFARSQSRGRSRPKFSPLRLTARNLPSIASRDESPNIRPMTWLATSSVRLPTDNSVESSSSNSSGIYNAMIFF